MPPVTPEQEADICRRYEAGESCRSIGAIFGTSPSTVLRVLVRCGVDMRPANRPPAARRALSLAQEHEVCRRYVAGESTPTLGVAFGVVPGTIRQLLIRHGIERRSSAEAQRKYACDFGFFDAIDTEVKAYVLGFAAADGNVYRSTLAINLSSKDRDHLLKIRTVLGSTHPIEDYVRAPSSFIAGGLASRLCIRSVQLTAGLMAHGVTPRKTFTLQWPDFLAPELLRHYLRGYSDGDGWFTVSHAPNRKRGNLGWGILGTEAFCSGAQRYLMAAVGVRKVKIEQPSVHRLGYGGNKQVSRIYRLLYNDATIYLLGLR